VESGKNGARTSFHMNFCGYVGHTTILGRIEVIVCICVCCSLWRMTRAALT